MLLASCHQYYPQLIKQNKDQDMLAQRAHILFLVRMSYIFYIRSREKLFASNNAAFLDFTTVDFRGNFRW